MKDELDFLFLCTRVKHFASGLCQSQEACAIIAVGQSTD